MGYPNGKPDCETFRETLPKIHKIIDSLLVLVLGGGLSLARANTGVYFFCWGNDIVDALGRHKR